ncbi:TRAP transporter substrate-binding protein [Orrella sp. 11846]|uniref:TRAP transporter substrate-binding protein n=1 Tax=Orrella sp. 11846 TaxID=3409913 RepID=UPI003B59ECC4
MKSSQFWKLNTLFAACALSMSGVVNAQQHQWDMSLAWPAGNFQTQNAEVFAQQVKDATNGELVITVHPGGELNIKGPDTLMAVENGLVQVADMLVSQQGGVEPLFGMDALPGLIAGQEEMKLFLKHARPVYDELAQKHNQKILYAVPWPSPGMFSKRPIAEPKDIEGQKIRAHDKPAYEFMKELGAVPSQMPWGEVVPALAAGTIDGVGTSASSGVDGKFWQFTPNFVPLNWATSLSMVTVNQDDWDKLSAEQKKAVESVIEKLEPEFWAISAQQDEKALTILRDNKMNITEPSAALKAEISRVGQPMWDSFAKAAGPQSRKLLDAYLAER